ncbi:MAG: hypothetical protein M0017_11180 [Desulfobacteraceae bacterium]|nr:hypothetical protein [Desulfobacteraceae bacterium]
MAETADGHRAELTMKVPAHGNDAPAGTSSAAAPPDSDLDRLGEAAVARQL